MIFIRKFEEKDKEEIWKIIKYVISQGDSFTFSPDSTREFVLEDWCDSKRETFVAVSEGEVVGTFYIKANQIGLGSHIANGGYAVAPEARGKGVGRKNGRVFHRRSEKIGI